MSKNGGFGGGARREQIRPRREKKILIFAPAYEPAVKAGGPVPALANLVSEMKDDHRIDVITRDRDLGDTEPFPGLSGRTIEKGSVRVHYVNSASPAEVVSKLREFSQHRYDLIILNGVWNAFSLLPAALRALHILEASQVLLLPHGELEEGALSLKRRKKALATPWVRALYRIAIDIVGSTSQQEWQHSVRWFPRKRHLLASQQPDQIPFGNPAENGHQLRLVFLGRVHPTKGLLQLIRALAATDRRFHLSIFGPVGDPRYWEVCQDAIRDLPEGNAVEYHGTVSRAGIAEVLHSHDLFISLTAGENFGHSIAESLQAGCPVVATDKTPWTHALRSGGGWVVADRDDSSEVASVLQAFGDLSREERLQRRYLARNAYDQWERTRSPNIVRQIFPPLPCVPG